MSGNDKSHPHTAAEADKPSGQRASLDAQAAHMAHLGHATAHPPPFKAGAPAKTAKPAAKASLKHKLDKEEESENSLARKVVIGLAVVAVAGVGWWAYEKFGDVELKPEEQLITQMQDAALGRVAPLHVFNGPLKISHERGGLVVTAYNLPPKACLSAGWRLVKLGTVSINGFTPTRLSAAKLSELCGAAPDGAAVAWQPQVK